MAEWEDRLPPIMREKLAKIGDVTPEEKERIKELDQLDSLMSKFHKGEVEAEGLWTALKDFRDKGKSYLLREAQVRLIGSLRLTASTEEFHSRRDGILAIETLKQDQNTASLEISLNSVEGLQKRYKDEMEQAYNSLKAEVERNPQLRMQQIQQGQTTMVAQLSVDEAVKISPDWKRFIADHERRYRQEFASVTERLKEEVK